MRGDAAILLGADAAADNDNDNDVDVCNVVCLSTKAVLLRSCWSMYLYSDCAYEELYADR